MRTRTEERLIDIIGWLWVGSVIAALVLGGSKALVATVGAGIAMAAAYLGYKYWRHSGAFRRRLR